MQILQVKTENEFSQVTPPEGTVLIWPQVGADNAVTLYVKLPNGTITTIAGGGSGGPVSWSDITGKPNIPSILSDLSDVSDLSEIQDGQTLVFDAKSQTLKPGTVGGGGGESYLPVPAEQDIGKVPIVVGQQVSPGNDADAIMLLHLENSLFTDDAVGSFGQPVVAIAGTLEFAKAYFDNGLVISSWGTAAFTLSDAWYTVLNGGDFTIDFRIKVNSFKSDWGSIFNFAYAGNSLSCNVKNGQIQLNAHGYDSQVVGPIATGQWYHIAFVYDRASSTMQLYLNGILVYQSSMSWPGITGFDLGSGSGQAIDWLLDEFRVSKVKRWIENFTPPTYQYGSEDDSEVALQYRNIGNTGGVPAISTADADPATGTVQIRDVTVNPDGSTSWAGETITVFYTFEAPNE